MVSTRTTKRSTPQPSTDTNEPPSKAAKTPEKPDPPSSTASTAPPSTNINTILLDIEGTICPITFVKEVLFPYFLTALPDHLSTHWSSPELAPYVAAFPPEHATNKDALMTHVTDLVHQDVKAPYLKALQGYIWEDGYHSGAYAAPVYGDVLEFLDRWPSAAATTTTGPADTTDSTDDNTSPDAATRQKRVAIYSSGSVPAQKLFLEHVRDPASRSDKTSSPSPKVGVLDKRPAISGWFDTVNAGPKQESGSYVKIAKELDRKPGEILFLSDNVNEVKAAIEAGMRSIVVEREGNAPLTEQDRKDYRVIETFDELRLS